MAQQRYECMFLLDSGRFAQDPEGTENGVREILERCEAEIVTISPWQEGKLAYEIDGHRKGLHLLTYFTMDGSQVETLNRICKLSDLVIRHLILEHEEKLFELLTQQFASHEEQGEEAEGEPAEASAS
ncbi:30S ribosomal protein S6 [Thalassoglobus sp. JC818]|uniref:30S ribosomal protein S6 n=1 Tax=Thalassoglobus sp. JC818 TaxID=3232136 RepID=UPI003458EF71